MRIPRHRRPTHPGAILQEEFLDPLGISQSELARRIFVSFPRVNELTNGKRQMTPDTALRLSKLFDTTPEFWMNLQLACDLWDAQHGDRAQGDLDRIERARELDDDRVPAQQGL